MFCYKLVGYNPEGSDTVALLNRRHYSEAEFQIVVGEALSKAFEKRCREKDILWFRPTNLSDLQDSLVEVLCADYDFQHIVYAVEYYYFDWYSLDGDGWDSYAEGDNCRKMIDALRSAGYPEELFVAWKVLDDIPPDFGEIYEEGLRAGMAFRLNEILGRRMISKLVVAGDEE